MYKTIISEIVAPDYYKMHQIIAQYFDGIQHIWRQDGNTVTVISEEKPMGELTCGMSVGTMVVSDLKPGEMFPILLRVNACRHVDDHFYALPSDQIPAWLSAHLSGFSLTDVQVSTEGHQKAQKPEHALDIVSYSVSAMVIVTDPVAATETMLKGVGRGRRFGFGLVVAYR